MAQLSQFETASCRTTDLLVREPQPLRGGRPVCQPAGLLILACLFWAAPALRSQVGMESPPPPKTPYPAEWPIGPAKDSAPAWARPGHIRFARWDGGRIETAKAMLSGWPGFNPPDPNRLETMTNWYRLETVRYLREAGINTIWITLSNGFSDHTEAPHREQVRRYIDECHRQGIHVMAYESIANMFWEDMQEFVPESRSWASMGKDGKPVPYGAGDYTKMGRVTRYMADLGNPAWRAYLRHRVDLAIDAGADGVIYDNNFSDYLLDVYRDIYSYGASRKKDFLLMGNFHENTYIYNRLVNSITTEDGVEPGVYENAAAARISRASAGHVPIGNGVLVNNMGLLRVQQALSEGWKPTMVEDGLRETGQRETTPMSAGRHKIALAEAMMFGISMELFVEGVFAHGLATGDPEIRRTWDAIGQYNGFFADHEEYYTGAKSLARLAVILDDSSSDTGVLNGLAARNVQFDVLYERDLSAATLAPYSAAAILTARTMRDSALDAIKTFVGRGGKLFAAGDSATRDEKGASRARPAQFSNSAGKYFEKLPPLDELAPMLIAAAHDPVTIEAPRGVLYSAASQPGSSGGRILVHLLNYTERPIAGVKVKVKVAGKFTSVRLQSPDSPREPVRVLRTAGADTELEVPLLSTYTVLVLER